MTRKLNYNHSELEREIKAAEKFLSMANEDILYKSNNNKKDSSKLEREAGSNRDSSSQGKNSENLMINQHFFSKYYKQLRECGFPEPGSIETISEDEKCKFVNFFEYVLSKKNYENEIRVKYKSQIDSLNEQLSSSYKNNTKFEKELADLTAKNKQLTKENKENENKINKLK